MIFRCSSVFSAAVAALLLVATAKNTIATISVDCEDNLDSFQLDDEETTCAQLLLLSKQMQKQKCNNNPIIVEKCPRVCNKEQCPLDCEDNPEPFPFKNGNFNRVTSCQDVSLLGQQKQNHKCKNNPLIIVNCPSVCISECEETPAPTANPSLNCDNNLLHSRKKASVLKIKN